MSRSALNRQSEHARHEGRAGHRSDANPVAQAAESAAKDGGEG